MLTIFPVDSIRDLLKLRAATLRRAPLVVVPTTYNSITEEELADAGVSVVIYANHMLRSAYPSMLRSAQAILKHHRSLETDEYCMPIKEILTLIPDGNCGACGGTR